MTLIVITSRRCKKWFTTAHPMRYRGYRASKTHHISFGGLFKYLMYMYNGTCIGKRIVKQNTVKCRFSR